MINIIPSILTSNPNEAKELLSKCEGVVDRISVDIIDGKFADNRTVEPDLFKGIEIDLKVDYQLMVYEPVNWIEKCVRGQADRIIGHIEHMDDQVEFAGKVQEVGAKVGLALDLETPITDLNSAIHNNLDIVLLMSVPAGFGGQKFNSKVINKIKRLSDLRKKDDTPYKIQVDGGVNLDNIKQIGKTGADEVSVGRKLFEGNLKENIEEFIKTESGGD